MAAGSFFNYLGVLEPNFQWSQYKYRHMKLLKYFEDYGTEISYCFEIKRLIEEWFELEYDPADYRLFLDSGKGSFKIVLLNNDQTIKPIPLLYSTSLCENSNDIDHALELIRYEDHK